MPQDPRFEVVPDWVGEILSPSTRSFDLEEKKPLYARYEVKRLWLIDPEVGMEAFVLVAGQWQAGPSFNLDEPVQAAPFLGIGFSLADLVR
jgi:Uma2 family endonuclease